VSKKNKELVSDSVKTVFEITISSKTLFMMAAWPHTVLSFWGLARRVQFSRNIKKNR
jgi:hypothetical protein